MPQISIIVPVFKVEKYINRCIESLINQTLEDIEIILVDDGSPDNCGLICDEYAKKDNRIRVIHKTNGGLGFARNSGLEIAIGNYIAFVDSDDFVSLNMYEILYNEAEKNNADVCLCGFNRVIKDDIILEYSNPMNKGIYTEDAVLKVILANMLGAPPDYPKDDFIGMSSWMGIYSKKIITENNIRFYSEREYISEDALFNIDYFSKSKRAAIIPDPLYYYCENAASLTKSYKGDRFQKCKILYKEIIRRIQHLDIMDQAKLNADRTFIANSRVCIMQEVDNYKVNGLKNAKKNIYSICSDSVLKDVLTKYPIYKLPIKQRIFSIFTKYKMVSLLFILAYLNSRGNRR